MERRILDLTGERRNLRKDRGSLAVTTEEGETRVPFDDIEAVIVNARQATYTNEAVLELSRRGIPLVACDKSHRPVAWLWPAEGNFEQTRRMAAQKNAKTGLENRLWARLVKAKIAGQAAVLEWRGIRAGALKSLARAVRPGDPGNCEARAAARYWPLAFGPGFTRDRQGGGINGLLNYGYIVVRSCCARNVMAAGLHPSIGLFHKNRFNAFCLIDDLMEPFRPLVDRVVLELVDRGLNSVEPESKEALVGLLAREVESEQGFQPLSRAMETASRSLAQAFVEDKLALVLPKTDTFFR